MESLQSLLDRNLAWAGRKTAGDPQFFRRLVAQQAPQYLWIGCSGIRAASRSEHVGPCCDQWLEHVAEVARKHRKVLGAEPHQHRREALLCELNVLEQTLNVCNVPAVRAAWSVGQPLTVHGWIYRLGDGRLRHLDFSAGAGSDIEAFRESALQSILRTRAQYYAGKA